MEIGIETEQIVERFMVMLREKETQNAEVLTAVSRNCEFCGKFTFTFRKNFYL
jgi:ribosomal protein S14